jgi:hypothetical protein
MRGLRCNGTGSSAIFSALLIVVTVASVTAAYLLFVKESPECSAAKATAEPGDFWSADRAAIKRACR